MRNIFIVIGDLIKAIPHEERYLLAKIDNVLSSIKYTAPELLPERWRQLSEVLEENLPYPPGKEWQKKVFHIFTGNPFVEEV